MWRPLGCADSERFTLVWETEELMALNNTLRSFVKNKASAVLALSGMVCTNVYLQISLHSYSMAHVPYDTNIATFT